MTKRGKVLEELTELPRLREKERADVVPALAWARLDGWAVAPRPVIEPRS